MPFNGSCMAIPWVKKAKQYCVVSYQCFNKAAYPDPGNLKCVSGSWDYNGTDPECKGTIIYDLIT